MSDIRCDADGFCADLQREIVPPLNAGMSVPQVCDMNTGTIRSSELVLYKRKSSRKEPGVWLSFCPFCGTNLGERADNARTKKEGLAL